ncbi:MAG: LCP family protein [Clostridia bacterium]|nr:LCP family protein [Clostridia bacterium]
MKCQFGIEDIADLVDGVLSIEAREEMMNHIKDCEGCIKIYNTLQFTKEFLKEENTADKAIDGKVLSAIDVRRYQRKRNVISVLIGIHRLKKILKPILAVFVICTVLFFSLSYGSYLTNVFREDLTGPFKADTKPVNILLLGGDKVNRNTDAMILLNYDPASAKLNMLSIPRDTYIHPKGSGEAKINSAYPVGGAKHAVDEVSDLLNVKIQYYIYMDTSTVVKLIDLLDGVDYYIPADMDYDDPMQDLHIHFEKGQKHLNGKEVLEFLRFRKPGAMNHSVSKFYDGSDLKRVEAQQNMIKAIIEQKINLRYITKTDELLREIFQALETNLTMSEALKLSQNISEFRPDEFNMFILPGEVKFKSGSIYYNTDMEKASIMINQYFKTDK